MVCLASPEERGPVYASYFFEIARKPLLIELSYRAQDSNVKQFQEVARRLIETVSSAR